MLLIYFPITVARFANPVARTFELRLSSQDWPVSLVRFMTLVALFATLVAQFAICVARFASSLARSLNDYRRSLACSLNDSRRSIRDVRRSLVCFTTLGARFSTLVARFRTLVARLPSLACLLSDSRRWLRDSGRSLVHFTTLAAAPSSCCTCSLCHAQVKLDHDGNPPRTWWLYMQKQRAMSRHRLEAPPFKILQIPCQTYSYICITTTMNIIINIWKSRVC